MQGLSTKEIIERIKGSEYTDIIFDFDETIARLVIDWSHFHEYMKILTEKYGVEEEWARMDTHTFSNFLIDLHGEEGKKAIEEVFEKTEKNHCSGLENNDMLIDFIKKNTSNYRFHILSNNMSSTLGRALKELAMEDNFLHIYGRDNVSRPKPFPDGIEKIIQNQGGGKSQFVMIGDNPKSDMLAADRAGVDSLHIDMYI